MDVTKPYQFIGFGAMDDTRPCKFERFCVMDVTKPYKCICFGGCHQTLQIYRVRYVTKPYAFIWFGAMDVTKPLSVYRLWGHG